MSDVSVGFESEYGSAAELAMRLAEDIKSQGLRHNARLAPLRKLAAQYETTYFMMRKAINLLADRGVLASRQGSGVYVTLEEEGVQAPTASQKKFSVVFCGFERQKAASRFYTSLLCGIEDEAALSGVELSVSLLRDPQEFIKRDAYSNSDGFLMVGEDIPGLFEALKDRSVVWMMGHEHKWGDFVSYDNRLVGVYAAEELVATSGKNLACINIDQVTGDERCRAFKEHAENLGATVSYLNHPEALVCNELESTIRQDSLQRWADWIEKELPHLDGVFVVDMVAYPLYVLLMERGIQPGRDLEIATSHWSDHVLVDTPYRPINFLLHPEEVGAMAVRHLLWRVKHPEARRFVMRMAPELEGRAAYRAGC